MAMEADQAGTVEFRYSNPQATELFLVGSFNGWNPHSHPMQSFGEGAWVCSVRLPLGVYQFHYLARLAQHDHPFPDRSTRSQWLCSALEMVVVTPRGGSFQMGTTPALDGVNDRSPALDASEDRVEAVEDMEDGLLPLSRLEAALIRGFRRLPDHESRSAFLDVMEESVYS
jgi:hypothetical protein